MLTSSALAQKVWTSPNSGLWSDTNNWSGHIVPDITSFVEILTNDSVTVTIDPQTPAANLTIQALTIGAVAGATNTVVLSSLGTNNPLVLQTRLELRDGGALLITNSAVLLQLTNDHVDLDGSLILDSGWMCFGDTTVTARVGRVTSGAFTINSGLVSVGAMTVGGLGALTNSSGMLNLNGGTLSIATLFSVGRNPGTTGTVFVAGGLLSAVGEIARVGDTTLGQMTVSNAVVLMTNLNVGRDPLSAGLLTLQDGGYVTISNELAIGRFPNSTGTVVIAGGVLSGDNLKAHVGQEGSGQLTVSSGSLQAGDLLIAADATNSASGMVMVQGGQLSASSSFLVGSTSFSTGQVSISSGAITVTNPADAGVMAVANGALTLDGGTVSVDNLFLTNTTGTSSFGGGMLNTKGTTVANGSPFIVGDGSKAATLHLEGGIHSFANGLIISSNATLSGCGTVIGSVINHGTIATNCGATAPTASFVGNPTNGAWPLAVLFTDNSSGTITNRLWDFGDGITTNATLTSFTHTYTAAGTYTVALTVTGPVGTNTLTRSGYIVATTALPSLSVSPTNLNFGLLSIGQSRTQSFQVVNSGGQSLTGAVATALPFAIESGTPFSLSAGQTDVVQITFSPTTSGSFSNLVVFSSSGGNATNAVTGSTATLIRPTITSIVRTGSTNSVSFTSVTGQSYTLEFKNTLGSASWSAVSPSTNGNGSVMTLKDASTVPSRFYRVRSQ